MPTNRQVASKLCSTFPPSKKHRKDCSLRLSSPTATQPPLHVTTPEEPDMKIPKIPMMLIQYSVIFGGCIAAATYFKPIGIEGNRELLQDNYKEDLLAIRKNNAAIGKFLKDSQSAQKDPELQVCAFRK